MTLRQFTPWTALISVRGAAFWGAEKDVEFVWTSRPVCSCTWRYNDLMAGSAPTKAVAKPEAARPLGDDKRHHHTAYAAEASGLIIIALLLLILVLIRYWPYIPWDAR